MLGGPLPFNTPERILADTRGHRYLIPSNKQKLLYSMVVHQINLKFIWQTPTPPTHTNKIFRKTKDMSFL